MAVELLKQTGTQESKDPTATGQVDKRDMLTRPETLIGLIEDAIKPLDAFNEIWSAANEANINTLRDGYYVWKDLIFKAENQIVDAVDVLEEALGGRIMLEIARCHYPEHGVKMGSPVSVGVKKI